MHSQSKWRDAQFSGESIRSDSLHLYSGHYDLIILCSSWDARSVCIASSTDLTATNSILLLFQKKDAIGLREKYDVQLANFAMNCSKNSAQIEGKSTDLDAFWNKLLESIVTAYRKIGRPMHVFLDASTCPRYYLLGILGACLGKGLAHTISVSYAEANYPERKDATTVREPIAFTEGRWRAVAAPFFQGRYSPSKKRFFLVSIGFEGWKTLRLVSRADPDRVSLLVPDPGFRSDYAAKTIEDNRELIENYKIPSTQTVRAPAADAVAAWQSLTESKLERPSEENVYYVCSGTKPHSIALGLRAMCTGHPAVLYNLPEGHPVMQTEPNGVHWKFEFKNLAVPI